MRILLINTNRHQNPPTPPIGLEYLVFPLEEQGNEVHILDLCFSNDVSSDCEKAIREIQPHLAGVTIRNIDTALYPKTEFFLDDIKEIITLVKGFGIPVVVGGSGYSAMPEEVLAYVRADYGIAGPGEGALPALVGILERGEDPARIIHGRDYPFDPGLVHRRGMNIDYQRYRGSGGVAGFETQKGCPAACVFCVEAKTPQQPRQTKRVIEEICSLVAMGNSSFHLCDSEFNIVLPRCMEFLRALVSAPDSIRWSLYMKPEPVSEELFALLKASGANVITLTVNSYEFDGPGYNCAVAQCIELAKKEGLTLAIDLLIGFPFESVENMQKTLKFFCDHRPFSVGVNYFIRIYPRTALYIYFQQHQDMRSCLIAPEGDDTEFVRPIFFRHPAGTEIARWIDDDPLFRLEGTEGGTNYQRFQKAAVR